MFGRNPPQRPDQRLQPVSRSGVGPAPQQGVFIGRLVIVSGSAGTGVYVYAGTPGPGNPPVFAAVPPGTLTDPFGNSLANATTVISDHITTKAPIMGTTETLSPGPFLMYGNTTLTFVTLTGAGNWTAPAGVTSVIAYGIGGGSGRTTGFGGCGGEFAQDTIGVTPGNNYPYSVGAGGVAAGGTGGNTTFAGDSLTLTAHGATTTTPGTGSTNSIHNNGGARGVHSGGGGSTGGAGGGGAGGPFSPGNAGGTNSGTSGGPGGAAVSGNAAITPGPGGNGGNSGANGNTPAGFGGGAGEPGTGGTAATGASGGLVLQYTSGGSTSLVNSMAVAAGVDPNTGQAYSRGITSIDPTFGDFVSIFGANVTVSGATSLNINGSELDIATVGHGLRVAEGANARQGRVTLAAGTSGAIANTTITAVTHIFLSRETAGAGIGTLSSARVVGTSFTINSTNGADTGVISWLLTEPG